MNDIKSIIEDVEKSDLVSDKVIKRVIEIIGQEKWQDINDEKSDICTTTGELIITLKRIPDLEKENAELKLELTKKADTNHSLVEQMADLESENAELKQQIVQLKKDVIENESDCANCGLRQENAELKKEVLEVRQHLELTEREWGKDAVKLGLFKTQFTKAIEIIKNCIHILKHSGTALDWKTVINQAEQFLKEIEK